MDPLTLGLLAGAGLLVLVSRRAQSQNVSAPQAGADGSQPSSPSGGGAVNNLKDVEKILGTGGAIAGALALSEVSSQVAKSIGQTELAGHVGRLGYPGVSAVAGAQLGKEFDRLFGGSGNESSGIAAQGTGAAVGFATGLGSLVLIVPGLLQIGFVIWIALVIYTDTERLRRGQAGATEDYWRDWNAAYASSLSDILRNRANFPSYVKDAGLYAERLAIAYADGFAAERNQQRFRAWMSKPRGVGMNAYQHAIYGRDRAYFAGNVASNIPNELRSTPLLRSDEPKYQLLVPDEEKA